MSETTTTKANESAACLLIYDIPDNAPIQNPSGLLRRFAIRVNLSCWVIRERDVNHPDVLRCLQNMQANGATWHTVKFQIGETDKLVEMAIESVRRDVRQTVASIRATVEREETRFGDVAVPLAEREKRYKTAARAAVRRGMRMITDIRAACDRFGIVANVYGGFLDAMSGNVSSFDATVKARCETFVTAVRSARRVARSGSVSPRKAAEIQTAVTAVANQTMPADIFADFMEENEIDGAAELRDAFQGTNGL
jgi:hypothetical protein